MGLKHEDSSKDDHVDVLIVGAGATGLMTALWMAELGVKTRLIDKRRTRTLRGQAHGLHVRSMEIWESFGMVDCVFKHGCLVNEWCLWQPDEDGELHRKQRKCALGTDISRFPLGITQQGHIEATMIDAITKRSGAKVERSTALDSIEVNEDLVHEPSAYPIRVNLSRSTEEKPNSPQCYSHVKKPDGSKYPKEENHALLEFPTDVGGTVGEMNELEEKCETVHTKFIVDTDGAQSQLRQHLGLNMSGDGEYTTWGIVDLRPISNFPDIRKHCTIQSEHGAISIVPGSNGLVRIYVKLIDESSDDTAFETMIDKIQSIMAPFKFDYSYCDWWSIRKVTQQVSDTYSYKDCVYFAGDTVHTHAPKGGQGLNVSIQDAYNLGWKLGMVLKGRAYRGILDTYERERQPVARTLIEMDTDLSNILSSKNVHVTAEDTKRMYERLRDYGSGINIHYEPSVINVNPMGPSRTNLQVGKRFPSSQVYSQATGRPVEIQTLLKSDGRWRLLVFAGVVNKRLHVERINELGEQIATLMKQYPSATGRTSFLDVLLVHASMDSEVNISDFHNTFFSYDDETGFDYDRVFTRVTDGPHEGSYTPSSKPGLSFGAGAMVVLRPDQHVGWIGRLDECDLLEDYFRGFLVPDKNSLASFAAA